MCHSCQPGGGTGAPQERFRCSDTAGQRYTGPLRYYWGQLTNVLTRLRHPEGVAGPDEYPRAGGEADPPGTRGCRKPRKPADFFPFSRPFRCFPKMWVCLILLFPRNRDAAGRETEGTLSTGNHLGASGGTADALASGASVRKGVGVQIPPRAQNESPRLQDRGDFFMPVTAGMRQDAGRRQPGMRQKAGTAPSLGQPGPWCRRFLNRRRSPASRQPPSFTQ